MSKINTRDRNANLPSKKPNWEYRFEAASIDGKRKQISKSGFKTKKEALEAGAKAFTEYSNTGKSFEPNEISVSDFLDFWIENYAYPNLADATVCAYVNIIKNHLKPRIGFYKLRNIDTICIQKMVNDIYVERGFSKAFMLNIIKVLKGSFKYAKTKAKFINYDPAADVERPSFEPEKPKNGILKHDDVIKLLERFKSSPYQYYAMLVAYYTGLRVSEVYGLTWDCIDLNNKTITINKIAKKLEKEYDKDKKKSVARGIRGKAHTRWYLGACKTKSSYRKIRIGDELTKALMEYKKIQEKNEEEYGEFYIKHYLKEEKTRSNRTVYRIISIDSMCEFEIPLQRCYLVMVKENGEFHGSDAMKYPSKVAKYELGIDFRFHEFRHTHATRLIENGASVKDVQERLGHENIETTLQTYVHDTEQMTNDTVNIFENFVRENNKTSEGL